MTTQIQHRSHEAFHACIWWPCKIRTNIALGDAFARRTFKNTAETGGALPDHAGKRRALTGSGVPRQMNPIVSA